MARYLILLACAGTLAACAHSPDLMAGSADKLFSACPGGTKILKMAADVSWSPQATAVKEHQEVRQKLGVQLPKGRPAIYVFFEARHHISQMSSLVATRGSDGIWSVDQVGIDESNMMKIEPTPQPHLASRLTDKDSRKLDSLLDDDCLYRSPTNMRNSNTVIGGTFTTLEIVGASHSWVGKAYAINAPLPLAIIKMLSKGS